MWGTLSASNTVLSQAVAPCVPCCIHAALSAMHDQLAGGRAFDGRRLDEMNHGSAASFDRLTQGRLLASHEGFRAIPGGSITHPRDSAVVCRTPGSRCRRTQLACALHAHMHLATVCMLYTALLRLCAPP